MNHQGEKGKLLKLHFSMSNFKPDKKLPGIKQLINFQNSKWITEEPRHKNTANGIQPRTKVLRSVQSNLSNLPDLANSVH